MTANSNDDNKLRDSEERFRAFVTASYDVVYRMSADWSEMRALSGKDFIADTENPSGGWLQRYIHPDDQRRVLAAIEEAIHNKSTYELEHRVIRVDGTLGWTRSRAIPMLDGKGEIVEWFGAASDVTERKTAEDTQKVLMSELDHRVKNTLAAVQAIAQHTLRNANDPAEFVTSFNGRIRAMSRVHSILTSARWQGADLHRLVGDQLMLAPDEYRVTVSGPAVNLRPQMARDAALMIYELGINSRKYGALATPAGTLAITWTIGGGRLRLNWDERGGGPVAVPLKRGFGTTLVERTALGQSGRAHMAINEGGLVWDIELPLPAQAAAAAELVQQVADATPPGVQSATGHRLAGKRLLVVEDEPLIALEIVDGLESAGAHVLGPAGTVNEALRVIANTKLHAALLDANLGGHPVDDVAAALARSNVPFIFVTGYGREALPRAFATMPMLSKPFSPEQLLDAAARVSGSCGVGRIA
ncbi:MAG: HWE histidine kinase domain-containing protein [Hyphomicrobiaceae bacterium]|nr:HWE histidine kinase domain-containing protein [Hyphomicrobiaceae bacterium]